MKKNRYEYAVQRQSHQKKMKLLGIGGLWIEREEGEIGVVLMKMGGEEEANMVLMVVVMNFTW